MSARDGWPPGNDAAGPQGNDPAPNASATTRMPHRAPAKPQGYDPAWVIAQEAEWLVRLEQIRLDLFAELDDEQLLALLSVGLSPGGLAALDDELMARGMSPW